MYLPQFTSKEVNPQNVSKQVSKHKPSVFLKVPSGK